MNFKNWQLIVIFASITHTYHKWANLPDFFPSWWSVIFAQRRTVIYQMQLRTVKAFKLRTVYWSHIISSVCTVITYLTACIILCRTNNQIFGIVLLIYLFSITFGKLPENFVKIWILSLPFYFIFSSLMQLDESNKTTMVGTGTM